MSLSTDIQSIQRLCGVNADGVFGPVTAAAVLRSLRGLQPESVAPVPSPAALDARTEKVISTLDPKAQGAFRDFFRKAKITAATFGCDYVAVAGNRTWKEQDELYAQPHDGKDNDGDGRIDEADEKVTQARGGQSNHNFGIAVDAGVFRLDRYLDDREPTTADKVHRACAVHARECGLDWGGDWESFQDVPHYEIRTGLTLAEKRALYQKRGSVL